MNEEDSVFTASPACVSRPGIPVASEEPPQGAPCFAAYHAGKRGTNKMWLRECDRVADAVRKVFDLVRADRCRFE